jgi:hypothetical protein
MKLLRDFTRLRAAGRRLLSGRRDPHGRDYAVTVPQPLHRATSELVRDQASATAGERGGKTSSHMLHLASSR